ncbi:hypothetical protein MXD59_21395 [Frankia sp. Ag45/Mut15]|uniref:MinD-like ATPase involved in chromosome partitioning or flagellar assembly n=1 Tax=Frankia umida TaxID=573489 RepID=A0ABT0K399_9ACTN|nr:hypothetical protein [Frankia umida]MCK9878294.1 hypothetical protein [Frankia umida]
MTTCWAIGTAGPGSPGATTLALALAAMGGGVVIEAGADGGVLAARCNLSLSADAPGLASLAVAATRGRVTVLDHAQACANGLPIVPASTTEETVAGALEGFTAALPRLRQDADVPLLLDVGRVRQATAKLITFCDTLVLVTSAEREGLACALVRLPGLFLFARRIVLVVRGSASYTLADVRRLVAEQLGSSLVPVLAVPDDPRGARDLAEGAGLRRRSALLRAADRVLAACPAPDITSLAAGVAP